MSFLLFIFLFFFFVNVQSTCVHSIITLSHSFPTLNSFCFGSLCTVSEYCRNTGTSTRRRMMTQHCWNEMHELHPLKWRMSQRGKNNNSSSSKPAKHKKLNEFPCENQKNEYPEGMWILIAWIAQKCKRISHKQSEVDEVFFLFAW